MNAFPPAIRHFQTAIQAPSPRPPAVVPQPAPRTVVRLWLPATALFLLLAPFALLSLPFLYLAPREVLPRPAATLFAIGAVLLSLGGTDIDVDSRGARVRLHLF